MTRSRTARSRSAGLGGQEVLTPNNLEHMEVDATLQATGDEQEADDEQEAEGSQETDQEDQHQEEFRLSIPRDSSEDETQEDEVTG